MIRAQLLMAQCVLLSVLSCLETVELDLGRGEQCWGLVMLGCFPVGIIGWRWVMRSWSLFLHGGSPWVLLVVWVKEVRWW